MYKTELAEANVCLQGTDSFDVTFFTSPLDQNGGGTEMGQIPALYFRAPFTY